MSRRYWPFQVIDMMGPNQYCLGQRASWRTEELGEPQESRDQTSSVNFPITHYILTGGIIKSLLVLQTVISQTLFGWFQKARSARLVDESRPTKGLKILTRCCFTWFSLWALSLSDPKLARGALKRQLGIPFHSPIHTRNIPQWRESQANLVVDASKVESLMFFFTVVGDPTDFTLQVAKCKWVPFTIKFPWSMSYAGFPQSSHSSLTPISRLISFTVQMEHLKERYL